MRDEIAQLLIGEIDVQIKRLESLNKEIPETVKNAVSALSVAVRAERESTAKITLTVSVAQKQILAAAQAASNAELAIMRKQLYTMMEESLSQFREEAVAPRAWKYKIGILALSVMLLLGVAGMAVGATWFGKARSVTAEQAHQLAIGRAFLDLLPKLDKATKEKLAQQLEKSIH